MGFWFVALSSLLILGEAIQTSSNRQAEAARIVEEMRGLSMILSGNPINSNGHLIPEEAHKLEILNRLGRLGTDAVPALIVALRDGSAQMRQNAAITLDFLALGLWHSPYAEYYPTKVDIRAAVPALTKALADPDANVRGHAAGALLEVGPDAKIAVPALINLLHDSWEGARLSSCAALRQIGPEAQEALPALRSTALNDKSADVRRCAEGAIRAVQKK